MLADFAESGSGRDDDAAGVRHGEHLAQASEGQLGCRCGVGEREVCRAGHVIGEPPVQFGSVPEGGLVPAEGEEGSLLVGAEGEAEVLVVVDAATDEVVLDAFETDPRRGVLVGRAEDIQVCRNFVKCG